jgi:thioredoxin-related protein
MIIFKIVIVCFLFISIGEGKDIDFNKLSAKSIKQDKHIMIFFHMEHCPYCKKMIKKTFNAKNISKQMKKYFFVADVNIDEDGVIIDGSYKFNKKKFAQKHHINLYPTLLFLYGDKVIHKVRGYRNKNKLVEIFKYITTKSYNSMDLATFQAELEFNK